jgi:O-antigen/teichoic acid export membrane protein
MSSGPVRSGVLFFAGDALARSLAFVVLALAARELGVADFGRFSLVYGVVAIGLLVSDLGITTFVLRRLSKRGFDARVFWTGIAVNLCISCLFYALVVLVFAMYSPRNLVLAMIYGPVLLIQAVATSVDAWLIAQRRVVALGLGRIVGNVGLLVVAFAFVLIGPTAEGFAVAFLVGGAAKLTYGLLIARPPWVAGCVSLRLARYMVRASAPFAVGAVASFLYFRVDIVLLGVLASDAAVGVYSAAYRFLDALLLAPAALAYTAFPDWARRRQEAQDVMKLLRFLVATGFVASFTLGVWGETFMRLVYGNSYSNGAHIVSVLSFGIPLLFVDVAAVWLAYSCGYEARVVFVSLCALGANVVANVLLIPAIGAAGAAWATVLSEAINAVGYLVLFRREIAAAAPQIKYGVLATLSCAAASGTTEIVVRAHQLAGPLGLGITCALAAFLAHDILSARVRPTRAQVA